MKVLSNRRVIDPVDPDPGTVNEAAEVIKNGGVVIFPTQHLYGLGADAFNIDAIKRIYRLKGRSTKKPILILISDRCSVTGLVEKIPKSAQRMMDRFWPGSITIVMKSVSELPSLLTASTGKIGIREVGHTVARAIINAVGGPITGTSANWTGYHGASSIMQLPPELLTAVDLVIDCGKLRGGAGSTIVDVTRSPHRIIREGGILADQIHAVAN